MRSASLLLLGLAVAAACQRPPPPAPSAAPVCPAVTPALVDAGREVFARSNCAGCHGIDARGTAIAPDLVDDVWLHADGSVASIAAVVTGGVVRGVKHPAVMPARGGVSLEEDEICAVAAYVHSLSPAAGEGRGRQR